MSVMSHEAVKRVTDLTLRAWLRAGPVDKGTHLACMGIASDIAERALNHALQSVEGIYNQYDYLLERRMALTKWAEYLHLLEQSHASPMTYS